MTLLGALSTAGIGLDVLNPQVMRRFVDGALAADALPSLLNLGGLYLGIALASQLVSVVEAYVAEVAGWTATNELRADLTLHLLGLDLAFFHRHPPGELIDRVDGDVSRLASFLSDMAVIVIGNVLPMAGIVVALCLQDWLASVAFALFCLVAILWLRPLVGRAVPRLTARRQAEADLLGFLEERLGATEDLRANGAAADAAGHLPMAAPSVEFADVSFSYGDGEDALRSLSFRLQPGERLGVVGRTRSGKTTLTRLLFRFYDPTRGCVRLAGLRSLRLDALRRRVGPVTQDVQVFHASVRDNVTFFDASIPDQRILDALRDLGLRAWLESLPDGLDS